VPGSDVGTEQRAQGVVQEDAARVEPLATAPDQFDQVGN